MSVDSSTSLAPPWPQPDEEVRAALVAAYADGSWGKYFGPHSQRLQALLTEVHSVRHAWLCSSGTIAVELALRGLKVGPGDEVIVAAYDFPGNFRAVEALGARPVLIDLAPRQWCIDVNQIEVGLSSATKAIVVSHLHGSLANMRRVCEIAAERGLAVVEDACQVPGAVVQGRPAGSWGDCGVLSFGGSKLLTAGRGGAVLTSRDDVLQRIKIFSQRGNEAFPLSELQAAVLVPQLLKLAALNSRRLLAARQLIGLTEGVTGIVPYCLPEEAATLPTFYKLPWLVGGNNDSCDSPQFQDCRRRFIMAAQAEGIMLDEGFHGFARRGASRCRLAGDLPNSRLVAASTVLLHHPVLLEPEETIERVAKAIAMAAHILAR